MTAVQSFHWTEDVNETLNYWFWLRSLGELEDGVLLDRVRHTLGLSPYAGHLDVSGEADFNEYLTAWRQWKLDQIGKQIDQSRTTPGRTLRAHYKAIAAIGAGPFTIQWVMAPFGERWVVPPGVVLLGADGGTPEGRREAVLDAAKALLAA